jgi:hypothetical protein
MDLAFLFTRGGAVYFLCQCRKTHLTHHLISISLFAEFRDLVVVKKTGGFDRILLQRAIVSSVSFHVVRRQG